ncbi:DsbA family protein [Dyella sp. Tek66A03]|uniref:DsbA family protein n=1 Tax=Dyella sp. Tek66A03 TaxID=3458298 RepID=UPI00403E672D
MKLIFVGDPMCSWCYGFSKPLAEVQGAFPETSLEIVVGGVGAGATEPLTLAQREFRLGHWSRVEAASGLPFDRETFKARTGFVYDTEPACRAVVAARLMVPSIDQLSVFRAIQHGFYANGLDVTDGEVLAGLVAEAMTGMGCATTAEAFLAAWRARETVTATHEDFQQARAWGISSFPTLLLQDESRLYNLVTGFVGARELRALIEASINTSVRGTTNKRVQHA